MSKPLTILIVHNHYQQRGGEDSVFETECKMLEDAGHVVLRYEKHNDEIGSEKGLGTRDQGLGDSNTNSGSGAEPQPKLSSKLLALSSKFQLFAKTIWNFQVYREITEVIERSKPDVVHCHNTFPLISPSVYSAAAKQGVPVVQTLHNYRLLCINPYLYRNGKICEACVGHSPIPGIIHKCYRDSLAASFTVAAMLMIHRLLGTYRNKVTTYIALTEFGRQKFIAAGLPASKIVVKPNAIAAPSAAESREGRVESSLGRGSAPDPVVEPAFSTLSPRPSSSAKTTEEEQELGARNQGLGRQDGRNHSPASELGTYGLKPEITTVLYVGRLSPEKGVDVLIRAWELCHDKLPLGTQLHIIGDGPERQNLESIANGMPSIIFLGRLPHTKIASQMKSATALVLPSICYEQFAITPLEAMQNGLPVIASQSAAHGTIIESGESGLIFETGNIISLGETLSTILNNPTDLQEIGSNGKKACLSGLCQTNNNLINLIGIYRTTIINPQELKEAKDAL